MSASEQILIILSFIFMLVLSGNVQATESINLVVFDLNGIIIKRATFDNLSNCQSVGEAYTKQGFSYGCY